MRLFVIVAMALILTGGVVAQQQASPRSPAARKALERRDYAVRKAEQEYRRALAEAHRTLIADLETAKAAAMKANQLDEANAIQAAIDAALAELDAAIGKTQARTFEIDATKPWQPTIEVRAGQRVEIVARGQWCGDTRNPQQTTCGPDGMTKSGGPAYYLEGRISSGQRFRIGSQYTLTADADGLLEMQMSDGNHSNNAGSVRVRIAVHQ